MSVGPKLAFSEVEPHDRTPSPGQLSAIGRSVLAPLLFVALALGGCRTSRPTTPVAAGAPRPAAAEAEAQADTADKTAFDEQAKGAGFSADGTNGDAALAARRRSQREAKALYASGLNQLRRGNFAEARKAFEDVRSRFPYDPHAALAELAEADAYFREARYIEAADAYRTFIRFHPTHTEVPYAAFEAAESQYAQLPYAWWFMPPVAEKDPGILHQTIAAYDDFLRRFPGGRNAERAEENRAYCQQKLAEHELYVARFYARRKLWAGARSRALNLLSTYPKLKTTPAALWLAGSASLALGESAAGQELLDRLVTDYPHAAEAKRARVLQARAARRTPES